LLLLFVIFFFAFFHENKLHSIYFKALNNWKIALRSFASQPDASPLVFLLFLYFYFYFLPLFSHALIHCCEINAHNCFRSSTNKYDEWRLKEISVITRMNLLSRFFTIAHFVMTWLLGCRCECH
jgi:hypothetical protein